MSEKGKLTLFAKDEASKSFTSPSWSNYAGGGLNYSDTFGSVDVFIAGKTTNSGHGSFIEGKYTTPKIANSDWAIELRTRGCEDISYETGDKSIYMTQRVAAKGSWSLPKNFSIYQIAGVNAKFDLQGNGVQSITPTSITGVGYKVTKNFSVYCEFEMTKGYNFVNNKWDKFGCGGYIGGKVTF